MSYWYIVADGARARLFRSKKLDGELEETDVFVNEKGRMQNREFDRDRPGRVSKGGERRAAMEKGDGPREHEEKKFAKRIAQYLNDAFRDDKFERLGIVAAPKALGRIKKELDEVLEDAIIGTSSKNLTRESIAEIEDHISKNLL